MKFFEPVDFDDLVPTPSHSENEEFRFKVAEIANDKLEREGRIVYQTKDSQLSQWTQGTPENAFRIALLINIELTEKCTHPSEKVKWAGTKWEYGATPLLECECGAKVKPKSFEVCE